MIDCKHKWPMQVTNRGINITFCSLYQKSVNDTICSRCADCEGETPKTVQVFSFPSRNQAELESIRGVCDACPIFQIASQRCTRMLGELHPVDILAANPSTHCPDKKW